MDAEVQTYEIDPSKFSRILTRVLTQHNLNEVKNYPTVKPNWKVSTLEHANPNAEEHASISAAQVDKKTSGINSSDLLKYRSKVN